MFQITDDFLKQAGFDALPADEMEKLRQIATNRVAREIGEQITEAAGEERSAEINRLMDGDKGLAQQVANRINPQFRESQDFLTVQQLGQQNGASDDDIVQQFAIFAWFNEQGINIENIVREAMAKVQAEFRATIARVNDIANADLSAS